MYSRASIKRNFAETKSITEAIFCNIFLSYPFFSDKSRYCLIAERFFILSARPAIAAICSTFSTFGLINLESSEQSIPAENCSPDSSTKKGFI